MMGCGDPTWRLKLARPLILFKREEAIVASNDFYASLPVKAYEGFHHFPTQFADPTVEVILAFSRQLWLLPYALRTLYQDRSRIVYSVWGGGGDHRRLLRLA